MNWKFLLAGVVYVVAFAILMLHCQQAEFQDIIIHFGLAFVPYLYLVFSKEKFSFYGLLSLGILLRLIAVYVFPNLSDDIYRFFWDGNLWADGIHPFDFTPSQLMQQGVLDEKYNSVFNLLNSKDYYTIYPPVCQWMFYMSSMIGGTVKGTAIVMKIFYLIVDVMTVFGLSKILEHVGKDRNWAFVYFLNPLIITELIGNIHAEALMVGGMVWMAYFLIKQKYWKAGIFYGIAIASKILPFLIGPLLLFYLVKKKAWFGFFLSSGLFVLISFGLMLKGSDLSHLMSSINLYFQSFEFNASIYYVSRWLGYFRKGYNMIGVIGPLLAMISVGLILWFSFSVYRKDKFDAQERNKDIKLLCLISLLYVLYLLFSTTIHPWYLAVPIAFAVFNPKLLYPIVLWSLLVMLSYSAYDTNPVQEHPWILAIEYGLLFLSFKFLRINSEEM